MKPPLTPSPTSSGGCAESRLTRRELTPSYVCCPMLKNSKNKHNNSIYHLSPRLPTNSLLPIPSYHFPHPSQIKIYVIRRILTPYRRCLQRDEQRRSQDEVETSDCHCGGHQQQPRAVVAGQEDAEKNARGGHHLAPARRHRHAVRLALSSRVLWFVVFGGHAGACRGGGGL